MHKLIDLEVNLHLTSLSFSLNKIPFKVIAICLRSPLIHDEGVTVCPLIGRRERHGEQGLCHGRRLKACQVMMLTLKFTYELTLFPSTYRLVKYDLVAPWPLRRRPEGGTLTWPKSSSRINPIILI